MWFESYLITRQLRDLVQINQQCFHQQSGTNNANFAEIWKSTWTKHLAITEYALFSLSLNISRSINFVNESVTQNLGQVRQSRFQGDYKMGVANENGQIKVKVSSCSQDRGATFTSGLVQKSPFASAVYEGEGRCSLHGVPSCLSHFVLAFVVFHITQIIFFLTHFLGWHLSWRRVIPGEPIVLQPKVTNRLKSMAGQMQLSK